MNKKGIARITEMHLHHICETDVSDRLWSLFVEDRGCQEAYRPSRTKESWLVQGEGGGGGGMGRRSPDQDISLRLLHCVLAAQETRWQLRRGSHAMMGSFPEAPGQMPNAADENLTYCSKTAGEMHNIPQPF